MSKKHPSNFDGASYRPLQVEAMAGDRPYGTGVLRAHASALQTAATDWGTEYTIRAPMSDADDVYESASHAGTPDPKFWYGTSGVTRFGSFLRIPYMFNPFLKSIEFTFWCRVSHEVVDSDNTDASDASVKIAARPMPNARVPPAAGSSVKQIYAVETFTAHTEQDTNSNWQSRWFQKSLTLTLDEQAMTRMVAPQFGWISLEVQSIEENRKITGPDTLTLNQDLPNDRYEYDGVENPSAPRQGKGSHRLRQVTADASATALLQTTVNRLAQDQSRSYITGDGNVAVLMTHGEHESLKMSAGRDYELEFVYYPYFQWRSVHVREKYYTREFKTSQLHSLIPPQSDTPRTHSRQAQDLQDRAELIYATDQPIRKSPGTSLTNYVDELTMPRKSPLQVVVYCSFIHTLAIANNAEYKAEKWSQIKEDSPDIDLEVEVRYGNPTQNTTVTENDTRNVPAYAESVEGPNVVAAKSVVERLRLGEAQGSDQMSDFAGEALKFWDTRKVWVDMSASSVTHDFRIPARLEVDAKITDGPNYPDGTPVNTNLGTSSIRSTLYHLAAWGVPA